MNPFGLITGLKTNTDNSYSFATGSLYWDDGESLDSIETKKYNLFHFKAIQDKNVFILFIFI